ncbi:MAG: glycosyltransferase family 4 protein, partial [Candidatus Microthrix subdominans]|jgi:glycosyltransferase involved in cell wall biosynthesis
VTHVCFIEDTHLHGGTQIWVTEAVRVFLAKGHEVTLLTPSGGFVARDGVTTDARVVTYGFDDVVSEDVAHQNLWIDALASADVAVCTVHPPRHGFHCSRFAARCIEQAGLSTVLQPKTGTIVPEYLREFYAPSEHIDYQVISITDFTRRYLIEHYGIPADRVSLIYQGTDVATFTPNADRAARARLAYAVPDDAFPVLGSLGSFEHRKGQVRLLEAVARVRESLTRVQLLLVGDGPDEGLLRAKVDELGLQNHVAFHPFTRTPAEVYEVIDILVLASLYKEGLPNVLLEAMSMGLPVVSSRLAGTPEVVHDGETGLLIEPDDVDGLVAAIEGLGGDPDAFRRMGAAGRRLMTTGFDKERQFDAFLEHFAERSSRQ